MVTGTVGLRGRSLTCIRDLSIPELAQVLATAASLKRRWRAGDRPRLLPGRVLALLLEKPSLRTRVSFEVAMRQLGGDAVSLLPQEIGLGERESVVDVARVLSRYVDAIVLRTFAHQSVTDMAAQASVPVINGLSDRSHPCQALADLLTIAEHRGRLRGVRVAFVGDGGNNVAHALLLAAAKSGLHLRIACPPGYEPLPDMLASARADAARTGAELDVVYDPAAAVEGADVVYTDVWTSMGQEAEQHLRRAVFATYRVDAPLVARAMPDAIVMHDLPAHRGEEITDDVLDGPRSVVYDQAENRLHAQKAVLVHLLADSVLG
ncbi:MAG: ornithine carbamoyltransferase [Chloroflexi bacterium]|nr:ornithine carbamoyltransferase [Chloroflexota bacterium]